MLSTPVPMKRLKLMLLSDDAQTAAFALAGLEVVHLQQLDRKHDDLIDFPAAEFHAVFHRIKSRYQKIMTPERQADNCKQIISSGTEIKTQGIDNNRLSITLDQLKTADARLKQLWVTVSTLEEKQRHIREKGNSVRQLQGSLKQYLSLEVDLSRIGRPSRFLNVVSGTVLNTNTTRLTRALSLIGYMLNKFYSSERLDYVVIVGPAQQNDELGELLRSADFRDLSIPEEFKDRPQMVRQQLNQQAANLDNALNKSQQELAKVISDHSVFLGEVAVLLHHAMPFASLAEYLKGKGSLVYLQGWVPESRRGEIHSILSERLEFPFFLEFEMPVTGEYEQVPTMLKNNPLVTPFQALVKQYGLPQYGEFDPGLLFALSYTLMFGMMFGDVGHGAVIVLLALALVKRSTVVAVIGTLAGLSSITFGFLYGSIFGYEHVLHPLWMSPMHDPQLVLLLALYWGIGFLIIANLLAIRNLMVRNQVIEALYSPHGVAGLLFYMLAIYSLMRAFNSKAGAPDWSATLLVSLMIVILLYQWKQSSGHLFERILVVFVEGLEFIISNVSATLSFLRVAAFSLNHIALAAAVFALAGMLDTFGHWVAILLGNVFIIVLEGAIVAIQCLRLEYYEGFSRFFSGKGRRYEPLKTEYL